MNFCLVQKLHPLELAKGSREDVREVEEDKVRVALAIQKEEARFLPVLLRRDRRGSSWSVLQQTSHGKIKLCRNTPFTAALLLHMLAPPNTSATNQNMDPADLRGLVCFCINLDSKVQSVVQF